MPDEVLKALSEPTIDVEQAGRLLGLARGAAYRARAAGDIPSIKVGGKYRVPTAKLREMLGLPPHSPSSGSAPLAA